ncbi:UNVERIFIED_CONTAM: bZIP transcription factor 17 [Sesamum radiatum]|uniref:BZIP transcription factor 17 n=1 Tax=Sesamum radiatum TaxID=300843 RepID=A0AAW2TK99_SESRA
MVDSAVVAVDPPPPPLGGEFESSLPIPPLDATFFSQNLINNDTVPRDNQNDVVVLEDLDFDFSFDDLCLPSADDFGDLLNSTQLQQSNSQSGFDRNHAQFGPSLDQLHAVFKSTSAELRHLSGGEDFSGDHSFDGSGILSSASPGMESHQISGYLNMPSPESNGSNRGSTENSGADENGLNCPSPESQGSGNFGSNVSEDTNNCAARSVSYSPNSSNNSVRAGEVDQKIKLEESGNDNGNNSLLKRKKEGEDVMNNAESRTNKYRKSNCSAEEDNSTENNNSTNTEGVSEEEEKRKARLMRNRESAQLSRQRKKHYVEELEEKVRSMHTTIQDLNAKISYFMAENATLRQQMGGGAAPAAAPPPPMAPPPPGIYPHPAMMYPWMPCPPPYVMKPQGSQVPLVPIPRLKQHKPAQAPKTNKKVESKKNEGPKTKKVAGVSFLGLLFFIMLFGGLVPMVNVRYGGVREAFTGGESYIGGGFNEKHYGRVLMVNGTEYSEKHGGRRDSSSNSGVQCGQGGGGEPSADELVRLGNGSEPLAASLYVPRNDKLVKIDGNLIIHSVLASEKAMASHGKGGGETGLAVPGDLARAISVPSVGRNGARLPHLRALGSGSADKDNLQSKATEGRLQQWFREGLAGPMLSAGMCTEVFQFDVSAAIVPATATRNISEEKTKNSTRLIKGKNRRILHSIPLTDSPHNISREHTGRNSEKEGLNGNKNASSMVVSVLFDPREAGDADVDGVMGTKSLSRIFVVVLIDSVKYVTYSCMLPFKGSALHLVTA